MDEIKYRDICNEFEKSFDKIANKIISSIQDEELKKFEQNIREIYDYNVKQGEKFRAHILLKLFCFLKKDDDNGLETVILLAWCLEIIQTIALIIDDIIDCGEHRRGKLCWYKKV